jgi:hypothetical protein
MRGCGSCRRGRRCGHSSPQPASAIASKQQWPDGYVCNPHRIVSAGNTLSIDLLEAVRDRWQQDGAPTADALRPGLTDAEMDDLTAPLDLRLPLEARTLWGWHDGAELGLNVRWIGRGWEPLPLSRAVSLTQEYRDLLWGLEGDDLGPAIWPESFLVMTRPDQPNVLAVDCDGDLPTSLVYHFDPEAGVAVLFANSIGQLIGRWLRAMETRVAHFDRSRSRWTYDTHAISATENI